MKNVQMMAAATFLAASLVAAAHAAPAQSPAQTKKGVTISKKALQAKHARDNQVLTARKKGLAAREQAQLAGRPGTN